MKKRLVISALLLALAGLVARPCANGRLVVINSWGNVAVDVSGHREGHPSEWSATLASTGPPVETRFRFRASSNYVRVKNLDTGEVKESKFGYNDGTEKVDLILIDREGIHFHEWLIQPLWKALALVGLDTLSCTDGR